MHKSQNIKRKIINIALILGSTFYINSCNAIQEPTYQKAKLIDVLNNYKQYEGTNIEIEGYPLSIKHLRSSSNYNASMVITDIPPTQIKQEIVKLYSHRIEGLIDSVYTNMEKRLSANKLEEIKGTLEALTNAYELNHLKGVPDDRKLFCYLEFSTSKSYTILKTLSLVEAEITDGDLDEISIRGRMKNREFLIKYIQNVDDHWINLNPTRIAITTNK
ncbi:MAG: hypothetical protein ABIC91_02250 [Nanoarchaeota archaeon]|nr:hypothetical protein [Nanoarchaeota archaeon]MBU1030139.1 hypothetical protein [Nanoarchaeota archaeon]MBU1850754.1 hypothetical protein [Nanoarchaeota archaeon]